MKTMPFWLIWRGIMWWAWEAQEQHVGILEGEPYKPNLFVQGQQLTNILWIAMFTEI